MRLKGKDKVISYTKQSHKRSSIEHQNAYCLDALAKANHGGPSMND